MSWITELADKAENILNKIDQNAASALQVPTTISNSLTMDENNQIFSDNNSNVKSLFNESIAINIENDKLKSVDHIQIPTSEEIRILENDKNGENLNSQRNIESIEKLLHQTIKERDILRISLDETKEINKKYSQSILELESHLFKMKQICEENSLKLDMQIKENQKQMHDFQEYKKKAQNALLAKDNLISELKQTKMTGKLTDFDFLPIDIDTLRSELSNLNDKLQESLKKNEFLNNVVEDLKIELSTLKENNQQKIADLQAINEATRKELRIEKEKNFLLQSEARVNNEKIQSLQHQISNQKAAFATRLQEKDYVIEQLNISQDSKSKFAIDNESRFRSLTLALVEKQNALESITVERNALKLQLEKTKDEIQKVVTENIRSNMTQSSLGFNANTTDDIKAQFPLLMKENPFDNRVARRVKRVYSTLDTAGIRLGVLLRRYPLIRTFVLIYIGILHIWVILVLLSSTPTT